MWLMNSFVEVESWEAAQSKSFGYEHPSVIRYYEDLASAPVIDSPKIAQRVEVLRKCWDALANAESPNVLDVGGGNGYMAELLQRPFKSWTVLESTRMARLYSKKFNQKSLSFVSELADSTTPDVCIISCVLHYLEKPEELFSRVLGLTDKVIILRHCETEFSRDRYAIQKIREPEIELSWPIRFFRRGWLADQLTSKHKILGQYEMIEQNNLEGVDIKLRSFAILSDKHSPNTSAPIND